ncbi:MAG TPA: (2Fe-2S) ferredoxin domain-containing protein [Allosphingosinicella sp.]|nr:(2Fe-2S) ferredoxin domain-containing protein [Allosphingosinicella sp.]
MDKKPVPYKKTLFVCVNDRGAGKRVSCGAAGAHLCELLKEEVKKAGLKGQVRVARSGCLDLCEQGPNVFCYPGDKWFSDLTEADIPELLKEITAS